MQSTMNTQRPSRPVGAIAVLKELTDGMGWDGKDSFHTVLGPAGLGLCRKMNLACFVSSLFDHCLSLSWFGTFVRPFVGHPS
jgi:hypothetical protein